MVVNVKMPRGGIVMLARFPKPRPFASKKSRRTCWANVAVFASVIVVDHPAPVANCGKIRDPVLEIVVTVGTTLAVVGAGGVVGDVVNGAITTTGDDTGVVIDPVVTEPVDGVASPGTGRTAERLLIGTPEKSVPLKFSTRMATGAPAAT